MIHVPGFTRGDVFAPLQTVTLRGASQGTLSVRDGDGVEYANVARNMAAQMGIPLIFSGLSKTQVENILHLNTFETSREEEAQDRTEVAGLKLSDIFEPNELNWWWSGSKWSEEQRPHMIFPFYVWNLEEEDIKKYVVKKKIIEDGNQSPLLTNMQLIPLMGLVDMAQFGYSSFEPEFAKNVRQGKSDRVFWRNTFEIVEYAANTGFFINESVDQLLGELGLTRKDVRLPE